MSCEAPYREAPDLMGRPGSSAANYGCFFRKQPVTPEEIDRACDAIAVSCVEAVRYAGNDPDILRKLYSRGSCSSCDANPTDAERQVIQYVEANFRMAKQHGVHWTYVLDESSERALIACCYGPYRRTLGVFALDKTTRQIDIIEDDDKLRPHFDNFKRPRKRRWWWPFSPVTVRGRRPVN